MSLDGFSMTPLITELNKKIAGGRIDKIFQPDRQTIVIWIRQPGENHRLVISSNPEQPRIYIAAASMENPATPPVFCMVLRKHLEDGRIANICQYSQDRIIMLNVDVRGEGGTIITKTLIAELMGKHSNIILTLNNTVIDAIRRIGSDISRIRQVLPGKEYILPPGQDRLNLFITPVNDFVSQLFNATSGTLVKSIINTSIGIGPATAKEIAWRAGLPGDSSLESLDKADICSLVEAIESILIPLKEGIVSPTVVIDSNNRLMGVAAFHLEHLSQNTVHKFQTMSEAIEFTSSLAGKYRIPEQDSLQKLVSLELNRLTRKLDALTAELSEANNADALRKCADLLMSNLYIETNGLNSITLPDFFSEQSDAPQITIAIDPDLSLLANAQQYYAKYNKLKRAQQSLTEQLTACKQELSYLASIEFALDHTTTTSEMLDIRHELILTGYLKSNKRRQSTPPSQPLKVDAPDGTAILIGKNNYQNDLVTFKYAQADDIWLHTKDIPGSHVILRTGNCEPSDQALAAAAQLAAYFSKARHSSKIPVDFTKRRYVKKPSGAKPGFVIYTHQKTLFITPEQSFVEKLINNKHG